MATKVQEVYCSAILSNGMEYMIRVEKGWEKEALSCGVIAGKTLDGKPIVIPPENALVFREISDEEFAVWQKSLEQYREEKLKEAQVANLSVN